MRRPSNFAAYRLESQLQPYSETWKMSESSNIMTDARSGVLRITLNRPDKLNSFNEDMHRELIAAIRA